MIMKQKRGKGLVRTKVVTRRVINFHKDNATDISMALLQNFTYAFAMVSVPVFVYIGKFWLIVPSLAFAYTMLMVLVNRPKYETAWGKFYMVVACTLGGTCSYMVGELIKSML